MADLQCPPPTAEVSAPEVRNLLWTGGWDSTFRLLDLLHSTAADVQPYYLISLGRRSSLQEMQTMHRILLQLQTGTGWGGRVRTPRLFISDQFRYAGTPYWDAMLELRRERPLGDQYLPLAIFRDRERVQDLELSIDRGCTAEALLQPWLSADDPVRLADNAPPPLQRLFRGFRFPLIRTDKREMERIAAAKGFLDLLELSWFCHKPVDDAACGLCNPCRHTIAAGLGRRVGEAGLRRHREQQATTGTAAS